MKEFGMKKWSPHEILNKIYTQKLCIRLIILLKMGNECCQEKIPSQGNPSPLQVADEQNQPSSVKNEPQIKDQQQGEE